MFSLGYFYDFIDVADAITHTFSNGDKRGERFKYSAENIILCPLLVVGDQV
jgi:hypothetical protein